MLISLIANSILVKYQKVKGMNTDFELSTFSITLITLVTNIKIGLIFALFPRFLASVHAKSFSLDNLFVTTTYLTTVIAAFYLKTLDILYIGIIVTVLDAIFIWIKRTYLAQTASQMNLFWGSTRFLFNIIVFASIGEIVLFILKL